MRAKRKSLLQERHAALSLGGKVQPASGATAFAKGDVRVARELLVECKTTEAASFSVSRKLVEKTRFDAMNGGFEDWVIQIQFQGAGGLVQNLAVLDWETYLAMRDVT